MKPLALQGWHAVVASGDLSALEELLAGEVVFHSPVVHTPQVGRPITLQYLTAALHVFGAANFRYVREIASAEEAVLEFEGELEGVHINGVDLIRWNSAGKITEFKVMLRPLQAVNLIHSLMGKALKQG